jgi:hypothetical protein
MKLKQASVRSILVCQKLAICPDNWQDISISCRGFFGTVAFLMRLNSISVRATTAIIMIPAKATKKKRSLGRTTEPVSGGVEIGDEEAEVVGSGI